MEEIDALLVVEDGGVGGLGLVEAMGFHQRLVERGDADASRDKQEEDNRHASQPRRRARGGSAVRSALAGACRTAIPTDDAFPFPGTGGGIAGRRGYWIR